MKKLVRAAKDKSECSEKCSASASEFVGRIEIEIQRVAQTVTKNNPLTNKNDKKNNFKKMRAYGFKTYERITSLSLYSQG